jgi:prephenate dehydrogenase
MPLFNKVAIIGTGLIGGSLALDIKRKRLAREVVGVSRHKKSIAMALKMKAIDRGSVSLRIIQGADLLIVATPVETVISLRNRILKYITKDCIITDVGSTKEKIVSSLGSLMFNYIGSHPLAGSEKRGIINASPCLFEGSLCILTPTKSTNPKAVKNITKFWNKVGAKTVILTPKAHDRALSFVSHLPHAVAFSLINAVPQELLRFASGGLKDTTRIAASDTTLWKDILLSNRKNLLNAIRLFENNLKKIKSAIKNNDRQALGKIILKSGKIRKSLG